MDDKIKKIIEKSINVNKKHDDLRNEILNSNFSDEFKSKFKELVDKATNSENVLFFDKHELDSLKKITKTTKISDYEVLTDDGFVDIEALHETIPYQVYELELADGKKLKCADNHIIFNENMEEVFVKDLKIGDIIKVNPDGWGDLHGETAVYKITNLGYEEVMYDLELKEGSNRRYYTNGILSHNTYLAKMLAESIFGSPDALIRVDMSEYMEKHSVSKLIGAPPGYVGYEEGGQLTEKIRRKPFSVILLDEVEKAHPDVFNILLQVFDDGHLSDGLGRKVDFKNCLIIMTSNVGARKLQEFGTGVGFGTQSKLDSADDAAEGVIQDSLKKAFSPEFLNRLDDIIIFKSLDKDDIKRIVDIPLNEVIGRVKEMGYNLKIDDTLKEYLIEKGYDEKYGARPLNRAIQRYVEDPIAERVLDGDVNIGDTITISYDTKIEDVKLDVKKPKASKKKEDKGE